MVVGELDTQQKESRAKMAHGHSADSQIHLIHTDALKPPCMFTLCFYYVSVDTSQKLECHTLAPPSRHVIICIIFRRMGEVAICSMNKAKPNFLSNRHIP